VNEFLDLARQLDLASYELRDLVEGRAAIMEALEGMDPEVTGADAERFDALAERAEQVGEAIEQRQQVQRREERMRRLQGAGGSGGGGGRSTQPPVEGRQRGPERRDDSEHDPVANPDGDPRHPYRLLRGIRCLLEHKPVDGLEGEISQEIARRSGEPAEGFYMPWTLTLPQYRQELHRAAEYRDLSTTTGAGAVATITAPTIIDVLRARMLFARLGAIVLDDMVGDFEIPKKTAGSNAYWVTEGNAPTGSEITIGQISFAPSTVGAFTDLTRKFIKQTSLAAENLARQDLTDTLRHELDRVGFNGSGTGAQPEGILQNADVPVVEIGSDGGAITWAKVVELETAVANADADMGNLAYVTSAAGRGALKSTEIATGTARHIWTPGNTVNGYQAHATTSIPRDLTKGNGENLTALLFGNFADAAYAFWGGIDVTIDPYAKATAGGVRVIALADAAFKLRRAESFAKVADLDPDATAGS